MAFVSDIVGPAGPVAAWKLGLAWVAFTVSIGALLASAMAAARSHDVALRKISKNQPVGDGTIGGNWTKATFFLNWTGFIAVVIGLVLLAWFAVDNFGGPVSDDTPSSTPQTEQPAPAAPKTGATPRVSDADPNLRAQEGVPVFNPRVEAQAADKAAPKPPPTTRVPKLVPGKAAPAADPRVRPPAPAPSTDGGGDGGGGSGGGGGESGGGSSGSGGSGGGDAGGSS
jgi:uncharacterized membrane protein YgcG